MGVWFMTVLTWVALSLHASKQSAPPRTEDVVDDEDGDEGISAAPRMHRQQRRNPFAPNYHTHFHCNCGKQRQQDSPVSDINSKYFFQINSSLWCSIMIWQFSSVLKSGFRQSCLLF
jgi:hypothetical protein